MQRGAPSLDTVVGRCIAQRRRHSHQLEGRDGGGSGSTKTHHILTAQHSAVLSLISDGTVPIHMCICQKEGLSSAVVSRGIRRGDNGPKSSGAVEKEDDIVLVFEKSWKSCHGCGMSCNGAGHDFTCCLGLT